VAAVAAGVLVQTSGLLQSQAESTGEDAQSEVGNQISVVSATGNVESNAVDQVDLVVKKSAGSDPIDLSDATIEYTSGSASATLTYSDSSDADGSTFVTSDIQGTTSGEVMSNTGDRVTVTISTNDIEGSGSAGEGLEASKEAQLHNVDQSGATTIYGVNVPDSLGDRSYVTV
jgi:archaellin